MKEQWDELKETIIEMSDNGDTDKQQFLVDIMTNLEKAFTEKFVRNLTIDEVWYNKTAKEIVFSWSANIGSGELFFYKMNNDDKWYVNTEGMGKDFVRMVLNKWVDDMEVR